jgi:RNA polymerase sigma factor (TIGR02999 family)
VGDCNRLSAAVCSADMSDLTRPLDAAAAGEPRAAAELLPLVYAELRKLAAARMAAERADHTLNPTALVHEAYLRLVGGAHAPDWNGRAHFFAAAAEAMRRILVESARRRAANKRGGRRARVPLADADPGYAPADAELLAIDEALDRLAAEDPAAARFVQLRYFAGLTAEEAADALGLSRSTAYEHWAYARARLRCLLDGE